MNPGDPDNTKPGNGLDADLEQVSREYRALGDEEPPAMLDQAVLNEARRAVAGEHHPVRPWNFGWMHATATVALLAIGLALVLKHRPELPPAPAELKEAVRSKDDSATMPIRLGDEAEARREDVPTAEPAAPAATAAFEMEMAASEPAEEALEEDAVSARSTMGQTAARKVEAMEQAETMAEPEVWLEAILEMKAAGNEEAWRSELDAFIAVYPDYPLPDELKEAVPVETEPGSE